MLRFYPSPSYSTDPETVIGPAYRHSATPEQKKMRLVRLKQFRMGHLRGCTPRREDHREYAADVAKMESWTGLW
jgi:hypothetical protein